MRSTKRTYPPKPPSLPPANDRFMQNKPNSLDAQMNVSTTLTTDYQNIHPHRPLQNKPNLGSQPAERAPAMEPQLPTTHPTIKMQNKPNFPSTKMNLSSYPKKDYGDLCVCSPRKNKPNRTHYFLQTTVQAFSLRSKYEKTSRSQRRESTFEHKIHPQSSQVPVPTGKHLHGHLR